MTTASTWMKLVLFAVAALLAACGQSSSLPAGARQQASWMRSDARQRSILVYAAGNNGNAVAVYDYQTKEQVGALTGFDQPQNGCVDAKGDVFITNSGNGSTYEYAHGGTSRIGVYATNGFAFGCSVSKDGDLAVTDFTTPSGPGQICIWKNASGNPTCYANSSLCYELWPAGYDNHGNLYVECSYAGLPIVAELRSGSGTISQVSFSATILQAGGVSWDGRYLTLTDQEFQEKFTAIYRVTESSSGELTIVGITSLGSTCGDNYVVEPFVVGKKNTPVNHEQGKTVVGADGQCTGGVFAWHYPTGGEQIKTYYEGFYGIAVGAVVSIGT